MKKICIATGTRAEYGLLKKLIDNIRRDASLHLILCVTGSHLSEAFGLTYKEIEQDGNLIDEKIDIKLESDKPKGIANSMALALNGFSNVFEKHSPDIVIVLGDRYEMLAVATAAMLFRIPIVHLYGGEATYGLIDEAIRHSITKMSLLHFASTEEYRNRIIQLGENPSRVFCVGSTGVENILNMELLSKELLEDELGLTLNKRILVITYHPVTLEKNSSEEHFSNLLEALDTLNNVEIIFTKANADTNGKVINNLIDKYVEANPTKAYAFASLGSLRYLSLLSFADAVIGNSSSGIIEAPSFKIPTVNIGDRQKGRIQAKSVINCGTECEEILHSIQMALSNDFKNECKTTTNPYEGHSPSEDILKSIKDFLTSDTIDIKKVFYDIEVNEK